jgi:hypothetical protein
MFFTKYIYIVMNYTSHRHRLSSIIDHRVTDVITGSSVVSLLSHLVPVNAVFSFSISSRPEEAESYSCRRPFRKEEEREEEGGASGAKPLPQ